MNRTHEAIVKIVAYTEKERGKTLEEVAGVIIEQCPFADEELIVAVLEKVYS